MDQHPNKYGYPIEQDVTTTGRNRNDSYPPERYFIRCKKCGYTMNTARHPKGRGEGNSQPYTTLYGAVLKGATTVIVDSTTGFPTSGYIYIYDTGYPNGGKMNKVAYTGTTATRFTGCTGVEAHADDMYVRGEVTCAGCPFCGTYMYDFSGGEHVR